MIKKVVHFFIAFSFFLVHSHADSYLILQDDWGGITRVNLSSPNNTNDTFLIRPVLNTQLHGILGIEVTQNGACQLFGNGAVFPVGKARLYSGMSPRFQAVEMAVTPDGKGGWIASHHFIKPIGQTPQLVFPKYDYPIRDIEYDTNKKCLIILLSNGDVAVCYPTYNQWIKTISLPRDETLDCELRGNDLYVLTKAGQVYFINNIYSVSPKAVQLEDIPNAELIDIELLPHQREGFYLLDSSGLIHSHSGAPRISGQPISAIDMEILQSDDPPLWYPPGWNTSLSFAPESIRVDPQGPEKIIQLWIRNAENVSSFSSEIHYDPSVLEVDPYIEPGNWWETNMSNATLNSQINPDRKGVLVVQGGGFFTHYNGASGSGELLKLKLSSKKDIRFGTTSIEIKQFSLKDASPLNFETNIETINPLQIEIADSHPTLSFVWMTENQPILNNIHTVPAGSVVRADLLVKEGSRIQSIRFNLNYSTDHFQFLGMTKGNAWRLDTPIQTLFPIPSQVRETRLLQNIQLIANSLGGCRDEPGSLVSILFRKKTNPSISTPGYIQIESLECNYHNGEKCVAEIGNLTLYLTEE